MSQILVQIEIFLAKLLDKLKVSSPTLFIAIQAVLVGLSFGFVEGTFHVGTPDIIAKFVDLNVVITALLTGLTALVAPRTTSFLQKTN